MRRKLTRRETLAHLNAVIAAASADGRADSATFLLRVKALHELVASEDHEELTLADIHSALFPGLKPESRRSTFSHFRTAIANAADAIGHEFALIQPPVRGKSASQIPLHFEGRPLSTHPDMDDIARRAVAGLDRQPLIEAPAAFMTGESLERLVNHFKDPKTKARLPVRFFLSYAHRNSKLKDKLLGFLADELAISSRFDFSIWQDKGILVGNEWHREIQTALAECDFCLSLLSPAFLSSEYIREHEIPPIVSGEIPAIPIELEPLDFARHDLCGLQKQQIFSPSFLTCATTASQKDFASRLAQKIEEKVADEAHAIARRFATDFLVGKRDTRDYAERNPEVLEILRAGEAASSTPPTFPTPSPWAPARLRINSLLTGCLKSLPAHLITPYAATGDLDRITREIAARSSEDDAPDPYSIFRQHQHSAIDHLANWSKDPFGAPFAAVLGEIGSGKTTTLQMLAQRLAKDSSAPPVIFIDLREYFESAAPTLEGILGDHLRRYDSTKTLSVYELMQSVRTQRALIIFDGLDEKIISLAEAARQNFIRELWRILPPEVMDVPTENGRGKLIISCRSHYFPSIQAMSSGYVGNDRAKVTGRDYLACVMLPWQDEQIREYLSVLLGEEQLETALDLIDTVHNLKDLASRPYLISLIGPELEELEKDRAAGRLVNAASLYRKFIERWLHRDDGKHVFTPAHKLRLMENLAAALWRENARTWPWERVEEWLETFLHENPSIRSALVGQPIAVLQQDFRTATFFLRPDACAESFRFAHTSLLEYFLACHLARGLEKADATTWDLPEPSRETFDFIGQHLLTVTADQRNKAISGLAQLLGDQHNPENSRLNALRYHLQAHNKSLPTPDAPALEGTGLDLEGWEFHGTTERPLVFGQTSFAKASLLRATFEHVQFQPGSDFRDTDLRSSLFYDCLMRRADFCGCIVDGAFFRECDQTDFLADPGLESAPVVTNHCAGSPWLEPRKPEQSSAFFAHRHTEQINSLAFCPNGKIFVSGSSDNTLRLWDADSGRCINLFRGHTGAIFSVVFSYDCKFILSGSEDNTLRLWDVASGKCIRSFSGHTSAIYSIAFSHDDSLILSGSKDRTLKVWDTLSGRCIQSFLGHQGAIYSVAFSRDNKFLLSGSWDNTLRLWDTSSGVCIESFCGHGSAVTSVIFSIDNCHIISGSWDKTFLVWNISSGTCISSFTGHEGSINSVASSNKANLIVSGSADKTVKIWDADSGNCIRSFSGHVSSIFSVTLSPDSSLILSSSDDQTLKFWEATSGKCIRSLVGHGYSVFSVVISPNGSLVAGRDSRGMLQCWQIDGTPAPVPDHCEDWFHLTQHAKLTAEREGDTVIRLRSSDAILREILPLPNGQSIVREPWDEEEATKPYHEIRWKFTRGPKDAWRWCHVVDPETNAIHPPELAAVPGAFSGPEVGPV